MFSDFPCAGSAATGERFCSLEETCSGDLYCPSFQANNESAPYAFEVVATIATEQVRDKCQVLALLTLSLLSQTKEPACTILD